MTNQPAPDTSGYTLDPEELRLLDAYWRAANYLSEGQIYLLDNPLLRAPLLPDRQRFTRAWSDSPA
jgi:xylulose-5-phosphate/fructose-6-phosphate phosphoketolase